WAAAPHATGGNWKEGAGPLGVETAALTVPLATVFSPYVAATVTYYFEKDFTVTAQQLAGATSIEITHQIDDGALFYIDGTELPRFGMLEGAVTPETFATPSIGDAAIASFTIPPASLTPGTHRFSVEVHQSSTASTDIVF